MFEVWGLGGTQCVIHQVFCGRCGGTRGGARAAAQVQRGGFQQPHRCLRARLRPARSWRGERLNQGHQGQPGEYQGLPGNYQGNQAIQESLPGYSTIRVTNNYLFLISFDLWCCFGYGNQQLLNHCIMVSSLLFVLVKISINQ